MAPRSSWKGHLKLSLVSCPVRLFNATSRSEKVSFHLLQKDTHNRIQMKPHDPELGPVERSDLVKGYEYEKDQYVVFTDEDFDKVQIESSKAIVIEKFVDAQEVDPIYFDTPYYLAPDGAVAEETYRVIQHAMREKQKVALSRIVLANRERLIALTCRDQGFLMMTLRTADEVRDSKDYFTDIKDEEPEAEMLDLAEKLIAQKAGKFDPSEFKDRYQDAVIEMVKAKVKGQEPVLAKAPERGKVINLMDALRRSLEDAKPPAESKPRRAADGKAAAASGGGKKPAAEDKKPAVDEGKKRRKAG
jgi:DNA end-binding protein Ku